MRRVIGASVAVVLTLGMLINAQAVFAETNGGGGGNSGWVSIGSPGSPGGGSPGGGGGSTSRWGKSCELGADQDATLNGGKPGPGYVLVFCYQTFDGVPVGEAIGEWTLEQPRMDPAEVAQRILKTLTVAPIDIRTVPEDRPGRVGLIGLPTWMWANPSTRTTGPQSASACIGGTCVDLTMKVDRIEWNMGDGNTVTCRGPGTPYADRYGKQDSPTCGHRYTRTSLGRPNQRYTINATSYWVAHWEGGGRSGNFYLDQTATSHLRIGELQVLVTQ